MQQPGGYGYNYGSGGGSTMLVVNAKSPGVAVILELLPGLFFQTFGIGTMYAGNVGVGLALMFGYWALTAINFFLCFLIIGFVTWPLSWIGFVILSTIVAHNTANNTNYKLSRGQLV